nr:PREDICTED: 40S ribosomal protein S11 [Lepisosteus oculatus]
MADAQTCRLGRGARAAGLSGPCVPCPVLARTDYFVCPQAIEGTYIDKKCPFTGNVSIRGRILSGVVTKMKMQRTIVIRRDYLHYIRKYNRFEKRHKNMSVHLSPAFR